MCARLFLSVGCHQAGSGSDGLFRKPSEGQSLISYLSEQDFGSCADLEKVNTYVTVFFLGLFQLHDSLGYMFHLTVDLIVYLTWLCVPLGCMSLCASPSSLHPPQLHVSLGCLTLLFISLGCMSHLVASFASYSAVSHFPLQENAHFSISESLIAAIELMKCQMRANEADEDGDSDCEIQRLKHKIHLRRQQIRRSRLQAPSSTHHSETNLVTTSL